MAHLLLRLRKTSLDINIKRVETESLQSNKPSWHSEIVTTLLQRRGWRCQNVVAQSKIRVVAMSVSDVVTTSLSKYVKTLPQRCYNVATTLSIWFLRHFITDNSDFFATIETWEGYKSTWALNPVFGKPDAPELIRGIACF